MEFLPHLTHTHLMCECAPIAHQSNALVCLMEHEIRVDKKYQIIPELRLPQISYDGAV